ncbi:GNAT family N-acetyltransferase [uncultured Algibacter sp.]|uniref:GNAT family N-acetyltransferase n=1 Tax=uncultured Algibacter sp. TaxID=298659 RepID=UPI002608156D|nr:GNAT family N-acetyltransferase [uncultured Algibacter sp.]
MSIIKKENFYKTLEEEQRILSCYTKLTFKRNNSLFYSQLESQDNKNKQTVSVSLFPSYLSPDFTSKKNTTIIKVPQKKIHGFAIMLKKNIEIVDFLKLNYKKKFIQNTTRYLNRFQNCLSPVYKLYFGEIRHDEYNYLMSKLKKMIETRFSQRGVVSQNIQSWEYYLKRSYDLIKSKRASLFVIYVNKDPVQITLNHHFKKKLFVTITSFDIKYSKFSLGNISIYKTLEWCLKNEYDLLDMAYGELPYKKAWSNCIYNFEHHILYQKNNIKSLLKAKIEQGILTIKNNLKAFNLDYYFDKRYKKNKNPYVKCNNYITSLEPQFLLTNEFKLTEFRNEKYTCIKEEILNFLYTSKEKLAKLKIYKNKAETNYLVIGNTGIKKICIQCKNIDKKNCPYK